MSKDGSIPHTVHLSSDGVRHKLIIDGVDLSRGARSAQLTLGTGELPTLTFEPVIVHLDATDLEAARVVVPDQAAAALVALGWTPPEDQHREQQHGT